MCIRDRVISLDGGAVSLALRVRGYEKTWRSERDPLLVRSFLTALRAVAPEARPSFVVKTGTSDMNLSLIHISEPTRPY